MNPLFTKKKKKKSQIRLQTSYKYLLYKEHESVALAFAEEGKDVRRQIRDRGEATTAQRRPRRKRRRREKMALVLAVLLRGPVGRRRIRRAGVRAKRFAICH